MPLVMAAEAQKKLWYSKYIKGISTFIVIVLATSKEFLSVFFWPHLPPYREPVRIKLLLLLPSRRGYICVYYAIRLVSLLAIGIATAIDLCKSSHLYCCSPLLPKRMQPSHSSLLPSLPKEVIQVYYTVCNQVTSLLQPGWII